MTVETDSLRISGDEWDAAVRVLSSARQVTLVCHVAPDGDALGSMLALAHVLKRAGVTVTSTWGDEPWDVPAPYRWLPGIDAAVAPPDVADPLGVLVVLDTSSRDRLGVLGALPERATEVVVIDHHAHAPESAALPGVQLVDSACAATAVVVAELIRRLGAELDEVSATLLYVGLVTDTGSFQHSVTTPSVHRLAARLLAAGARPDVVAQQLWGSRPFGFQRVLASALARVALEPHAARGFGMAWTWIESADLAAAGIGLDEVEPVIDVVRSAREADVAVVCKQDGDRFRVSIRSRGAVDVGAACASLGGGGHRLAAGFTSYDELDVTMARLRTALDDAPPTG
ncbi:MAG: DHH family phosphoesterase [Frankiales bacterium]|nr:DHH family phosphoesterase [Frankiales bacterium]